MTSDNKRAEGNQMESNLAVSNIDQRILNLLGQGIQPEAVANALGISPARISQLMSDENFATEVTDLRYKNLQKHNIRDSIYDEIEDDLQSKLKKSLPLMFRPETLLKAIQIINSAKRRGQSAPEAIVNQQTIVNITLPTQVLQKFVTNTNNQVVKVGSQDLLTMQSGTLQATVQARTQLEEIEDDSTIKTTSSPSEEFGDVTAVVGNETLVL